MLVRFLPELMQNSVRLGDVLDRFCVLLVRFCCRLVCHYVCLLWPAVMLLDEPILPPQSLESFPDRTRDNTAFPNGSHCIMPIMRMGLRLAQRMMDLLIPSGCSHEFAWPRKRQDGEHYQVCRLCGAEYAYDWRSMRRCGRMQQIPQSLPPSCGLPPGDETTKSAQDLTTASPSAMTTSFGV